MKNKSLEKAIKGMKKGALHKDLGIAPDKKIPTGKLQSAAQGNDKTAKRARFALVLAKMRGKKKARGA